MAGVGKSTRYETEWKRQKERLDIPPRHLPVHRWYLRLDRPADHPKPQPPRPNLSVVRACQPTISFYRFLYHTAGEDYLWGDRRRMSDDLIMEKISRDDCHLMVLYAAGTPAGFFEMKFQPDAETHIQYFALLPGFTGGGLGSYLLSYAIDYASQVDLPLILDTCTLDHPVALENYCKRGFKIYREEDEIYLDPRLDGTIRPDAAPHVPRFD